MSKEELYIYTSEGRMKLDLQTPSEITLEFVNNMFNDISKITPSHSYTFKIPRTINNSLVLKSLEDVRHISDFTKNKYEAEYIKDGVSLFDNCNIYISSFEDDYYLAALTWDVNTGLKSLSENDFNLRNLKGVMYTSSADYDYEQDDISSRASVVSDFSTYENYNCKANLQFPIYSAGYNYFPDGYEFRVANPNTSFQGAGGSEITSFLSTETAPRKQIHSDNSEDVNIRVALHPRAVMPLPYLIGKIEDATGVNFHFGDGIIDKLCVPLVSAKLSDAAKHECYVYARISDSYRDGELMVQSQYLNFVNNPNFGVLQLTNVSTLPTYSPEYSSNANREILIPVVHNPQDFVVSSRPPSSSGQGGNGTSAFERGYSTKLELEGSIRVDFMKDYIEINRINKCPKIKVMCVYGSDVVAEHSLDKSLCIAEIDGYYDTGSYHTGDSKQVVTAVFCFNPDDGYETIVTNRRYGAFIYFKLDCEGSDFELKHATHITGDVKIYDLLDEYTCTIGNVFQNLPDISCMDLLKSVFYALGGFPRIDEQEGITLITYKDVIRKIQNYDISDWSNKVLLKDDALTTKKDFTFSSQDVGTLAQNNYYLMKNDELDDFGVPKPDKRLEDLYKHSFCNVPIEASTLPKTSTIFTSVFHGAFSRHANAPHFDTGNGTRHYSIKKKNYVEIVESEPVLGVIGKATAKRYYWNSSSNTKEYIDDIDLAEMKVWQFPENAIYDEDYALLYHVFGNPCIVEEEMILSAYDLKTLDITTPVHIAKYNSDFIIKKIETKQDDVCIVQLMRIPPQVYDIELSEKDSSFGSNPSEYTPEADSGITTETLTN